MKTDLLVLIENGAIDMLSAEKIGVAFQQLRDCSDQLEQMVFGAGQDLSKDDLAIDATLANHAAAVSADTPPEGDAAA